MSYKFIFSGGSSKRYHTVETITSQDIAAHSFGVAWLCELFTEGCASKNLIMAALAHDLAEHIVGDIPSPSKRTMGIGQLFHAAELQELATAGLSKYDDDLAEGERYTLQLADMVEGMLYCIKEMRLGNRNMKIVFERFYLYANEVMNKASKDEAAASRCFSRTTVVAILNDIIKEWEKVK